MHVASVIGLLLIYVTMMVRKGLEWVRLREREEFEDINSDPLR